MIDKGISNKWFIRNPSNCECECDVEEYFDYENCKCRKKNLVNTLVEEWSENIDGKEMIYNEAFNDYRKVCKSCIIYITLFVIAFLIISCI